MVSYRTGAKIVIRSLRRRASRWRNVAIRSCTRSVGPGSRGPNHRRWRQAYATSIPRGRYPSYNLSRCFRGTFFFSIVIPVETLPVDPEAATLLKLTAPFPSLSLLSCSPRTIGDCSLIGAMKTAEGGGG